MNIAWRSGMHNFDVYLGIFIRFIARCTDMCRTAQCVCTKVRGTVNAVAVQCGPRYRCASGPKNKIKV